MLVTHANAKRQRTSVIAGQLSEGNQRSDAQLSHLFVNLVNSLHRSGQHVRTMVAVCSSQ